jgi:hypothetical protein
VSEPLLIAIVGAVAAVAGAGLKAVVDASKNHLDSTRMLLKIQADNQALWRYNRALVDHIYSHRPPPPPEPPTGLFEEEQ